MNNRREFLGSWLPAGAVYAGQAGGWRDVIAHGAASNGKSLSTHAIQQAIEACAAAGGGTVYFPPGVYLSGALVLKSRVRLYLEAGATLLGSPSLSDYPSQVARLRSYTDNYTEKSLLYAEGAENIAIAGDGALDGQGGAFQGPYKVRPYMLRFIACRRVSVTGVLFKDSPMWVQHYLGCEDVNIRGITVRSRINANNDGIDIDACDNVRISDCDVSSGDDAIVLKSTLDRPCRRVAVSNCVLSSHCNALKLGTETNGGFEDIVISNCAVYDTRLSGVALEIVDGGTMDRVAVSNLTMNNVGAPIFIRLGNRARPFLDGGAKPGVGKLRNVTLANFEVSGGSRVGCAISGIPGHRIENLTMDNIRMEFVGGGTMADAGRDVPENEDKYPEHHMFGTLPVYGFFLRHARNVRLRSVQTGYLGAEERPALSARDVEGLEMEGCRFAPPRQGPAVRLPG